MSEHLREYYEEHWRRALSRSSVTKQYSVLYKEKRTNVLLNEVRKLGSGRVLDYGCGTSSLASKLAAEEYEVAACDISETLININREKYKNVSYFVETNEEGQNNCRRIFDVVVSSEVIEHVFDVDSMTARISNYLNRDGHIIISTPYHGILKVILLVLLGKFEQHFNVNGQHIRFFTKKSLYRHLTQHGFSPVRIRYFGRIWPLSKTMIVVARKTVG